MIAPSERQAERQRARAVRSAFVGGLSPLVRSGLQRAAVRGLAGQLPDGSRILSSYAAVGDELDPISVHDVCPNHRIAYPRVVARDAPLAFHVAPRTSLIAGALGIPEPAATDQQVVPDVLLVPLLVADRAGNRLGQGGGFYDRTLARLRAAGSVMAIGIGWDIQLVEAIAAASWDQPLDAIATPSAFHWCRQGAMPRA